MTGSKTTTLGISAVRLMPRAIGPARPKEVRGRAEIDTQPESIIVWTAHELLAPSFSGHVHPTRSDGSAAQTSIYKDRKPLTGTGEDAFGWLPSNKCSITSCCTPNMHCLSWGWYSVNVI